MVSKYTENSIDIFADILLCLCVSSFFLFDLFLFIFKVFKIDVFIDSVIKTFIIAGGTKVLSMVEKVQEGELNVYYNPQSNLIEVDIKLLYVL